MNIIFDFGHPGHVHLFKNTIKKLVEKGHYVFAVVRERENTVKALVENIGIEYKELHPNAKGIIPKAITMLKNDFSLLMISKKIRPDILVSMTSPYSAQISSIIGKPHITFVDTEDAKLILNLTVPFTDAIVTESNYHGKIPAHKHIPLPTWRPLAYLHPKYFKPRKEVLDALNVSPNDKFFIMRFSAWDASHDWRINRDFTWEERFKIVKMLERFGYVFITSELPIPTKLSKYKLNTPPNAFHDVLAYSSGYIGEGHMTAREAVCLGKPSILVSPRGKIESALIDMKNRGFLKIIDSYKEIDLDILSFVSDKNISLQKKIYFTIGEMTDITAFLSWFIEKYPSSMEVYKEDKEKITSTFKFDG